MTSEEFSRLWQQYGGLGAWRFAKRYFAIKYPDEPIPWAQIQSITIWTGDILIEIHSDDSLYLVKLQQS
jgi:hypothetical protein